MKSPSYSAHFETLTALVTHLAMTEWSLRTPRHLAKALSIEQSKIEVVLEDFKGLFCRSPNLSKTSKSRMYTLQLRRARQWLEDEVDDDTSKPPLDIEYLIALLEFITHRANEETRNNYAIRTTLIASGLALVTTLAAIGIGTLL